MAKQQPLQVRVERTIAAEPQFLYDMISDITRMGEWSPETVEAHWLNGATGPVAGAKFKGANKLGPNSWSTKPTVTEAERGQVFAFKVPGKAGPTWRYEFHATPAGTRVVEAVSQDKASPPLIRFLQRRAGVTDRHANLTNNMTITLDRLATAATA